MKSEFLTPLLGQWQDDDTFVLHEPLQYKSALLGDIVTVPAGFVTDFASVPRIPFIYELFGDRAHHESVIHDFLYQTHMTTKGIADSVFLEAMEARGKSRFIRYGMYYGVVIGGQKSYDTGPARFKVLNMEDKQNG